MLHEIIKRVYKKMHEMGFVVELKTSVPKKDDYFICDMDLIVFIKETREPYLGLTLSFGNTSEEDSKLDYALINIKNLYPEENAGVLFRDYLKVLTALRATLDEALKLKEEELFASEKELNDLGCSIVSIVISDMGTVLDEEGYMFPTVEYTFMMGTHGTTMLLYKPENIIKKSPDIQFLGYRLDAIEEALSIPGVLTVPDITGASLSNQLYHKMYERVSMVNQFVVHPLVYDWVMKYYAMIRVGKDTKTILDKEVNE